MRVSRCENGQCDHGQGNSLAITTGSMPLGRLGHLRLVLYESFMATVTYQALARERGSG